MPGDNPTPCWEPGGNEEEKSWKKFSARNECHILILKVSFDFRFREADRESVLPQGLGSQEQVGIGGDEIGRIFYLGGGSLCAIE